MSMQERMTEKNVRPSLEAFAAHMGTAKPAFEAVDAFLMRDFNPERVLKMDAHSRCWTVAYHRKKKYICNIIAERDAFTLVTRLSEAGLRRAYAGVEPYAKMCMENSPFYQSGWIEYRVLEAAHLKDAETIILARNEDI